MCNSQSLYSSPCVHVSRTSVMLMGLWLPQAGACAGTLGCMLPILPAVYVAMACTKKRLQSTYACMCQQVTGSAYLCPAACKVQALDAESP